MFLGFGIAFAAISAAGFIFWIIAFSGFLRQNNVKMEKVDRVRRGINRSAGPAGFSVEAEYVREKGIQAQGRAEMTSHDLFGGIGKKDPGAIQFAMVWFGFAAGILGLLFSIGFFLLHDGNTDGWFLIGVPAFFGGLLAYLIISSMVEKPRHPGL